MRSIYHLCVAKKRSVRVSVLGHRATVLIVAGRSATVNSQAATLCSLVVTLQDVAGRSTTVGTVA